MLDTDTRTEAAWLLRVARGLAGPADAEDVAQDAWVVAHEHPPDRARPRRPWIRVVARRIALMARRRTARWEANAWRLRDDGAGDTAETEIHRTRVLDAVKSALDELGATDRDIVVRRYFLDQDAATVAADLGLHPGAVRTRLSRALSRLRAALDREFGGREAWASIALFPWALEPPAGGSVTLALALGGVAVVAAVVAAVAIVVGGRSEPGTESSHEVAASAVSDREHPVTAPPPESPTAEPTAAGSLAADWAARRRRIRNAHLGDAPVEPPNDASLLPVASSSSGAAADFKSVAAELKDATTGCVPSGPGAREGTLKLDVHVIAEPDIGAIVDEIEIASDGVGDPELVDCLTQSIPSFHVETTRARLDQHIDVIVDAGARTLAVHAWLEIDDLPAHLQELRDLGLPEDAVERRRAAVESSDDKRVRTGWLLPYDALAGEDR